MIENLDPAALPEPGDNYTHGTLVTGASRMVFVSGQVHWDEPPDDFEAQCRTVWGNVLRVLAEAGMGVANLAKVTIYLADREYRAIAGKVRAEVLKGHRPALTIIIAEIYDESWLLEIEAVAVD